MGCSLRICNEQWTLLLENFPKTKFMASHCLMSLKLERLYILFSLQNLMLGRFRLFGMLKIRLLFAGNRLSSYLPPLYFNLSISFSTFEKMVQLDRNAFKDFLIGWAKLEIGFLSLFWFLILIADSLQMLSVSDFVNYFWGVWCFFLSYIVLMQSVYTLDLTPFLCLRISFGGVILMEYCSSSQSSSSFYIKGFLSVKLPPWNQGVAMGEQSLIMVDKLSSIFLLITVLLLFLFMSTRLVFLI